MSTVIELIDSRIKARSERKRATVLKAPSLKSPNSATTGRVWAAPMDIGDNKVLEDVIIKAASDGSRAYARTGQPVFLERNASGRWQAVGPADRKQGVNQIIEVDQDTAEADAPVQGGLQTVSKAYDFFATINPDTGNVFYGESPYQNFRVLDADGNEV